MKLQENAAANLSELSELSESHQSFDSFGLDPRLVSASRTLGIERPTPIQCRAIPPLLEGRDVIGGARTGSGKTAAYGLPLLDRLKSDGTRRPRALVMAPTRELVMQVSRDLRAYSRELAVPILTIYGGVPYSHQLRSLAEGVLVVVGTPGRLLDHLDRKTLDLTAIEMLVLDEADEMLRMGFIEDVERLISATPQNRQVALFSATMPKAIQKIAQAHLKEPVELQVESSRLTVEHIDQRWTYVPEAWKPEALARVLASGTEGANLVFTRTCLGAAEVAEDLIRRGFSAAALHGGLGQPAREEVLRRLRAGQVEVVVATDVASRGLDIDQLGQVINYNLPEETERYVHRIGRTGRAGRRGRALSFVLPGDMWRLSQLERDLKTRLTEVTIPTDEEVLSHKRSTFQRMVRDMADQNDLNAERSWLSELVADGQCNIEDIAAVAVRLHTQQDRLALRELPPEASQLRRTVRREESALPRMAKGPRKISAIERTNQVEVFFPLGKQSGVRPSDVVGAIANDARISGRDIGKVTLLEDRCFVGLPREVADDLLQKRATISLHGRQLQIRLAKTRGPVLRSKPQKGAGHNPLRSPGKQERAGKGRPAFKKGRPLAKNTAAERRSKD